jgi:hypothetical protein
MYEKYACMYMYDHAYMYMCVYVCMHARITLCKVITNDVSDYTNLLVRK